jgi:hypothetical protein
MMFVEDYLVQEAAAQEGSVGQDRLHCTVLLDLAVAVAVMEAVQVVTMEGRYRMEQKFSFPF